MRLTPKKRPERSASGGEPDLSAGSPACPLCLCARARHLLRATEHRWGLRDYRECPRCGLIFVAPEHRLGPHEEKARYDLHQNDPADPGYVRFLGRLAVPLAARLRPASRGLDYGCGPGPALAGLLEREGHVVEHLFSPREVFLRFERLLGAHRGLLGLTTGILERRGDFEGWWYRRDPTHVAFYRRRTFEWIAGWRRWSVEFPARNVIIYTT